MTTKSENESFCLKSRLRRPQGGLATPALGDQGGKPTVPHYPSPWCVLASAHMSLKRTRRDLFNVWTICFAEKKNRIGLAHHRLEIEQSPCALLFWAEKGSTSRLLRRNRDLFSPLSGSRRAVSLLNLHFVIPVQRWRDKVQISHFCWWLKIGLRGRRKRFITPEPGRADPKFFSPRIFFSGRSVWWKDNRNKKSKKNILIYSSQEYFRNISNI